MWTYVCMSVCVRVCIYIYTYIHIYRYIDIDRYIYIYIYIFSSIHADVYTRAYIRVSQQHFHALHSTQPHKPKYSTHIRICTYIQRSKEAASRVVEEPPEDAAGVVLFAIRLHNLTHILVSGCFAHRLSLSSFWRLLTLTLRSSPCLAACSGHFSVCFQLNQFAFESAGQENSGAISPFADV